MKLAHRAFGTALAAVLACAAAAHAAPGTRDARGAVASWPKMTKDAALALIEKYGRPSGTTDRMLVWDDAGPWKSVTLYRRAVKRDLPAPREYFLEDTIAYEVPAEKVQDLIEFDPALVIDETRGTLSSQSDGEKANILALNLAGEIVDGRRSVASAQEFMSATLLELMAGRSSPYAEKLMISSPPKTGLPGAEPPATGY
ncbi:MAG TPA: hypothetical protein VH309_03800 [Elusimicrobiota bacterium]|jgi:hypothetical protein|nr:hypothetical protein [Elusimicrobiota bacterium]